MIADKLAYRQNKSVEIGESDRTKANFGWLQDETLRRNRSYYLFYEIGSKTTFFMIDMEQN